MGGLTARWTLIRLSRAKAILSVHIVQPGMVSHRQQLPFPTVFDFPKRYHRDMIPSRTCSLADASSSHKVPVSAATSIYKGGQTHHRQQESSDEGRRQFLSHETPVKNEAPTSPTNTQRWSKFLSMEISTAVIGIFQRYQSPISGQQTSESENIASLQQRLARENEARLRTEFKMDEMRLDRDEWKKRASDLEQDKLELEGDEARYLEKLRTSKAEAEALKTALRDSQTQLGRLQQAEALSKLSKAGKTSDSTILGEWRQLRYNIRNLAFSLKRKPVRSELTPEIRDRLRQVSRSFETHIEDEDLRTCLMQAYIWRLVCSEVFYSNVRYWQSSTIRRFKLLRGKISQRSHLFFSHLDRHVR